VPARSAVEPDTTSGSVMPRPAFTDQTSAGADPAASGATWGGGGRKLAHAALTLIPSAARLQPPIRIPIPIVDVA